MNEIKLAFKVAFSSDQKLIYQYWETHNEKIRIQTYVSIVVTCLVASACLLLSQNSAGWLYGAAAFVFLFYHFNNLGFVVASKLPVDSGDSDKEGRYEYLDRITNKTTAKRSNSPLYFIAPHFLYVSTAITLLLIAFQNIRA